MTKCATSRQQKNDASKRRPKRWKESGLRAQASAIHRHVTEYCRPRILPPSDTAAVQARNTFLITEVERSNLMICAAERQRPLLTSVAVKRRMERPAAYRRLVDVCTGSTTFVLSDTTHGYEGARAY